MRDEIKTLSLVVATFLVAFLWISSSGLGQLDALVHFICGMALMLLFIFVADAVKTETGYTIRAETQFLLLLFFIVIWEMLEHPYLIYHDMIDDFADTFSDMLLGFFGGLITFKLENLQHQGD